MRFITSTSVTILAALASVGEASRHARHHRRQFDPPARVVTVYPVPVDTGAVDPIPTSTASPSIPLATYPGPVVRPVETAPPVSSETVTLTYTLGTGTDTRVITTTVCRPAFPSDDVPTPTESAASPEETASEDTTILESTSTTTHTVTVEPTSAASPEVTGGAGGPGGPGDGAASCVPVTVTETATVTVTAPATEETSVVAPEEPEEPEVPEETPTAPEPSVPIVVERPPAESSVEDVGPIATPPPIKVPVPPFVNSTAPAFPTTAQSTGFLTVTLPVPTGGYAAYPIAA